PLWSLTMTILLLLAKQHLRQLTLLPDFLQKVAIAGVSKTEESGGVIGSFFVVTVERVNFYFDNVVDKPLQVTGTNMLALKGTVDVSENSQTTTAQLIFQTMDHNRISHIGTALRHSYWTTQQQQSLPSLPKIKSCGLGMLYFFINYEHSWLVRTITFGVKKVKIAVAEWSDMNALKLYLCIHV
nr:hypothetical protein [Tanacetum cinerariifolium]